MKTRFFSKESANSITSIGKLIKIEQYLIPLLVVLIDTSNNLFAISVFSILAGQLYHATKRNQHSIKSAWIPFWFNALAFQKFSEIVNQDPEVIMQFLGILIAANYVPHAVVKLLSKK